MHTSFSNLFSPKKQEPESKPEPKPEPEIPKVISVSKIPESKRMKYGLDENGQKVCKKCHIKFTPNKFTPYQESCNDCSRGGKNDPKKVKSSGGEWITTKCNACGCSIRIKRDTMSAFCSDHCGEEERRVRMALTEKLIQEEVNKKAEAKVYGNGAMASDFYNLLDINIAEAENFKQTIDKFSKQDVESFNPSIEIIYVLLLCRGFKLTKDFGLYKEYDVKQGLYSVSLTRPPNFLMGFCVSYPHIEKLDKGKFVKSRRSEVLISPNFSRIPDPPEELQSDITPLLELRVAWTKEIKK